MTDKNGLKTYGQLAKEWGVSKSTVKAAKNRVDTATLKPHLEMRGNTAWLDAEGQDLIKAQLAHAPTENEEKDQSPVEPEQNDLRDKLILQLQSQVEDLRGQLSIKDQQIAALMTLQVGYQKQIALLPKPHESWWSKHFKK